MVTCRRKRKVPSAVGLLSVHRCHTRCVYAHVCIHRVHMDAGPSIGWMDELQLEKRCYISDECLHLLCSPTFYL